MRIQCFLHYTSLHKCSARNSGALFGCEAFVPEAHGTIPKKHTAAVEGPHGIFSRMSGDIVSTLMIFSREEQAELAVEEIPSSMSKKAHVSDKTMTYI